MADLDHEQPDDATTSGKHNLFDTKNNRIQWADNDAELTSILTRLGSSPQLGSSLQLGLG